MNLNNTGSNSLTCPGCGRQEVHKMCPAHGTKYYMSGKVFTEEMEKELKEKDDTIGKFDGDNYWLSNFYHCDVTYEGQLYRSSEGAYQAAKTLDPIKRSVFENVSAGMSKRMGRKLELRADWEEVKDDVMRDILRCKFDQNPKLKQQLIATGDKKLVEGNHWGDTYWGVCHGEGKNMLGKLLMELREEIIGKD